MKPENTKLLQDPDKSFIVHHEINSFAFLGKTRGLYKIK